jgi:hypothetical protein
MADMVFPRIGQFFLPHGALRNKPARGQSAVHFAMANGTLRAMIVAGRCLNLATSSVQHCSIP